MATGDIKATDLPPEVDDWLELLNDLVDNVKAWAEAAGWETRLTARDVNEKGFARYEVPVLLLDRGKLRSRWSWSPATFPWPRVWSTST